MRYTVTSPILLTVTRGALSTTAAAHVILSDVEKQMTSSIAAPVGISDVSSGQSIRFKLHFTYDSSHKNTLLSTSGSILRAMCVSYRVDSDPTLTQSCNLVGKAATTANPSSCD